MRPGMRRREFIAGLGSAAAWPMAARGAAPDSGNRHSRQHKTEGIRGGCPRSAGPKETGFIAGQNVVLEQRWANDQHGSLAGNGGQPCTRKGFTYRRRRK